MQQSDPASAATATSGTTAASAAAWTVSDGHAGNRRQAQALVRALALPAQDWALRVTLVYRREGAEWRLAHRHADPLAAGVSLEQAAALARGKAA